MMTSCFNENEWWHDLLKEKEKQIEILRKVYKMRWEEMNRMKDIIKRASDAPSCDTTDNILDEVEEKDNKCITCGEPCDNIKHPNKDYCCFCVPVTYINKPKKEWICKTCRTGVEE